MESISAGDSVKTLLPTQAGKQLPNTDNCAYAAPKFNLARKLHAEKIIESIIEEQSVPSIQIIDQQVYNG